MPEELSSKVNGERILPAKILYQNAKKRKRAFAYKKQKISLKRDFSPTFGVILAHRLYITKLETYCQGLFINKLFILALVEFPTKPVPLDRPKGNNISVAYFS